MSDELGAEIRLLRKQRGLTQRRLAEAVGIDFTYLSKIENDALPYAPSEKTLRRLADELGADELDLLRLAHKLPPELDEIASTEQGVRFLRRAARLQNPEDWEKLLALMEDSEGRGMGENASDAAGEEPR